MNANRLTELRPGGRAVVCGLDAAGDMRRRLQDMGLIQGTEVRCLERSPLGDPVAYQVRGAVIALRCEDACTVRISGGAAHGRG